MTEEERLRAENEELRLQRENRETVDRWTDRERVYGILITIDRRVHHFDSWPEYRKFEEERKAAKE